MEQPNVETLLQPNRQVMLAHVEHLFGGWLQGCQDGLVELAWTETTPNAAGRYAVNRAQLFSTDNLDGLVEMAVRLNATPMCNVYIGAALRKQKTPLFGRSDRSDILALPALYADLDDAEAVANAKHVYGDAKPTLVVLTGMVPHSRAQLWWKLDEPLFEAWSDRLEGIEKALGGDAVSNSDRIMRLAGSVAWPVKPGRVAELTAIVPLSQPGLSEYMPEHLAQVFPFTSSQEQDEKVSAPPPGTGTSALGFASDRLQDGRERHMHKTVMACLAEFVSLHDKAPTAQELFDAAWPQYERGVDLQSRPGRGPDEMVEKCRATIRRFLEGKIQGARTIEETRTTWQRKQAAYEGAPGSARRERKEREEELKEPPKPPPSLDVVPAFPIDPMSIPTRPWIIPGLLIRNHVSVLVAPPGVGKSLLTLQVALACGANLPWGGWTPRQACRVLVINSEDDLDEMRRRLVASVQVMGISQESVADKVFLADNPETIVIAKTDPRSKAVMRTPLVDAIIDMATRLQIDLIVVDPFAETFEGDENSNSELKWAAALWREIARKTNSAVWLVHHTRKYAQDMTGDADAARGAGALVGVARIVATAFVMAKEAAEGFNIEEPDRHRYIRYDSAKANLSLVTGEAKWFEKVGQSIGNSKGLRDSDEVGVLKPWNTPGILDGVSGIAINQILQTISNGVLDDDGRPIGITWSGRRQAKKRWAGNVIMDTLQCDADKAAKIIKAWLASELLIEFDYDDAEQRPKKGLRVNFNKRPGAEA